MGLTRPRFEQLNTIVTTVSDPILVLNKGSTMANVDSGFIINRDGGISSNAAIIWQESTSQFVLGLTADAGAVNSNISIGSYATLKVNTLYGNIGGGSTLANTYVTGSLIPSANVTYDLGSPTQRWREGWFSGSTIHIGSESISVDNTGKWSFTSAGSTVEMGKNHDFNPNKINVSGAIVGANLTVSGNATANFFYGNGSQLSGIITSVTKIINGSTDITAYDSGNIAVSVGGTANTVVFTSSNIHITGSLIPTANLVYDLGSPTKRWRDAYFAGSTIYLGNAILSSSGEDIVISTTGGFGVPVGSTAQRTTTQGAIRYNTTISKFEAYDGTTWNALAYGSVSDFPSGEYGDVSTITADAFGIALATTYDCNVEGALTYEDFGALT